MDSTKVKRPVLRYHGGKFLLAKWIISHFPPHRIYTEAFGGFGSASTNAKHSTGFRSNSNRSGTTPAQDWNHFPDHIQSFVDRLKGVVIENRDFAEVIQQLDTADTLHYLDPPYPHSTRNMQRGNAAYAHEMNDLDHVQMADVLKTVRGGGVIISGYRCDLYDELFPNYLRVERKAFADGAAPRVECLWINPAAASKQNKKLF